ncbi:MAG: hypothetical protein PHY29_08215 [Syntrophales bacterium]|nr:hypothetical protein [Syntrophales bacterium]
MELYNRARESLGRGVPVRNIIPNPEDETVVRELNLITVKKVLYVTNVGELRLRGK